MIYSTAEDEQLGPRERGQRFGSGHSAEHASPEKSRQLRSGHGVETITPSARAISNSASRSGRESSRPFCITIKCRRSHWVSSSGLARHIEIIAGTEKLNGTPSRSARARLKLTTFSSRTLTAARLCHVGA